MNVQDVIEAKYQHLFKHATFNRMQCAVFPQAFHSNLNMVIAAPTGSGKTVIHELAIVRLISSNPRRSIKCVFIAPNKALCQQRMREWESKFGTLGLIVLEVTGDIDLKQCLRLIAKASIIITTPEKWDSLTRVWKEHIFLLGAIDLLLIDEVHHLGEDRGYTLETLVVRMRLLNEIYLDKLQQTNNSTIMSRESMRIIALSATLPNLSDIGEWLHCMEEAIHYFDESYRPVPLTVHTLSMGSSVNNPFLFEKSLDERVSDLLVQYSEGKQVLIFCASKNSTENLCQLLAKRLGSRWKSLFQASMVSATPQTFSKHRNIIQTVQDHKLRELLLVGLAYHHSGLPPDDRMIVEQLYLEGNVQVLCSTSTLAHGVNLPAHLVIIKGTSSWRGGSRGYERTSKSDIIQMLGRAGRPGFDTHGIAIIMTSQQDKDYFAEVSLHADIVESKLQGNLVEAICTETTQTVISNIADCLKWIKNTFFYIRARKDPSKYGFNKVIDGDHLDKLLSDTCIKAIQDLSRAQVIGYDTEKQTIQPYIEAHIMTRSLIKFETMDLLIKLPQQCTLSQLLREFCFSKELDKPVRRLEKKILNDFMKAIRYPLKLRVQDPAHKSYVLLQAAVARLDLKDFAMKVEQAEIVESALRVLSALRELCIERKRGCLLENAILLDRALRTRMWESNYGSIFLQCPGLLDVTKNSLILRGVRTLGDVEDCTLHKVQDMAGCTAPEARNIVQLAKMLRAAQLVVNAIREGNSLIIIVKSLEPRNDIYYNNSSSLYTDAAWPVYQLVAYDIMTAEVVCHRKLEKGCKGVTYKVPFSDPNMQLQHIKCSLLSNYVGIDSYQLPEMLKTTDVGNDQNDTAIELPKKNAVTAPTQIRSGKNKVNHIYINPGVPSATKVKASLPTALPPAQNTNQTTLDDIYPSHGAASIKTAVVTPVKDQPRQSPTITDNRKIVSNTSPGMILSKAPSSDEQKRNIPISIAPETLKMLPHQSNKKTFDEFRYSNNCKPCVLSNNDVNSLSSASKNSSNLLASPYIVTPQVNSNAVLATAAKQTLPNRQIMASPLDSNHSQKIPISGSAHRLTDTNSSSHTSEYNYAVNNEEIIQKSNQKNINNSAKTQNSELSVMRRKAIELQLDNIPVKRIRSTPITNIIHNINNASSTGNNENFADDNIMLNTQYALSQRVIDERQKYLHSQQHQNTSNNSNSLYFPSTVPTDDSTVIGRTASKSNLSFFDNIQNNNSSNNVNSSFDVENKTSTPTTVDFMLKDNNIASVYNRNDIDSKLFDQTPIYSYSNSVVKKAWQPNIYMNCPVQDDCIKTDDVDARSSGCEIFGVTSCNRDNSNNDSSSCCNTSKSHQFVFSTLKTTTTPISSNIVNVIPVESPYVSSDKNYNSPQKRKTAKNNSTNFIIATEVSAQPNNIIVGTTNNNQDTATLKPSRVLSTQKLSTNEINESFDNIFF